MGKLMQPSLLRDYRSKAPKFVNVGRSKPYRTISVMSNIIVPNNRTYTTRNSTKRTLQKNETLRKLLQACFSSRNGGNRSSPGLKVLRKKFAFKVLENYVKKMLKRQNSHNLAIPKPSKSTHLVEKEPRKEDLEMADLNKDSMNSLSKVMPESQTSCYYESSVADYPKESEDNVTERGAKIDEQNVKKDKTSLNSNKLKINLQLDGSKHKVKAKVPSSPQKGKLKKLISKESMESNRKMSVPCKKLPPPSRHLILHKLKQLREEIKFAVKERKIFAMLSNCTPIRRALILRGWIEKPVLEYSYFNMVTCKHPNSIQEMEEIFLLRLLAPLEPNLVWGGRRTSNHTNKKQITSRLPIADFTTKVGLCTSVQNLKWIYHEGESNIQTPRSYKSYIQTEREEFISNYRLTACISVLKWFLLNCSPVEVGDFGGSVPTSAIMFAMKRCDEYCVMCSHKDIDKRRKTRVGSDQWAKFLSYHYMLVHQNQRIAACNQEELDDFHREVTKTLERIKPYWSEIELDGITNTWILKPGYRSRGLGIYILNTLDSILSTLEIAATKDRKYIIQKYVETPLLMYNTKFDIRQWFLVTSTRPLVIWMYDECYLRFCSEPFSLSNLHKSGHLCNNSVQRKYYDNPTKNPLLPKQYMCDLKPLKHYLALMGQPQAWRKKILPAIKSNIIGAMLASQENLGDSRGSFELFGADFILTEDLMPWLLEINASPAMHPTTHVTAQLCPMCLEDIIRVVIDRKRDHLASTGLFRCIYRQKKTSISQNLHPLLLVKGTQIDLRQGRKNKLSSGDKSHDNIITEAILGKTTTHRQKLPSGIRLKTHESCLMQKKVSSIRVTAKVKGCESCFSLRKSSAINITPRVKSGESCLIKNRASRLASVPRIPDRKIFPLRDNSSSIRFASSMKKLSAIKLVPKIKKSESLILHNKVSAMKFANKLRRQQSHVLHGNIARLENDTQPDEKEYHNRNRTPFTALMPKIMEEPSTSTTREQPTSPTNLIQNSRIANKKSKNVKKRDAYLKDLKNLAHFAKLELLPALKSVSKMNTTNRKPRPTKIGKNLPKKKRSTVPRYRKPPRVTRRK